LGDGREHGVDVAWDTYEANELYERLENEVIPEFFKRNDKDMPIAWLARMRESMSCLTPQFSTNRTVREYIDQHYLPAAIAYRQRSVDKGKVGKNIINWENTLNQKWGKIHFGNMKVQTNANQHIFEVEVYYDDLDPNLVRVELYADGTNGKNPIRQEMKLIRSTVGQSHGAIYSTSVSTDRLETDYTARVIPHCDGVAVPLEVNPILWQQRVNQPQGLQEAIYERV
jgi:starch phosphorylase